MKDVYKIVRDLVPELEKEFSLPRRKIAWAVTLSAFRAILAFKKKRLVFILKILTRDTVGLSFSKIKDSELRRGDDIPIYRIEIIKDLIRKAAMRKLARIEENQGKKTKERKN